MAESKNLTADGDAELRSLLGGGAYLFLTVALGLMILGGTVFFYSLSASPWVWAMGLVEGALLAVLARFLHSMANHAANTGSIKRRESIENDHAQKLTLQNHYYQLLHEASLGLINRMGRLELMQSLMRLLAEVSGINNSFLFLLDPATNRMVRRFGWGIHSTMPVDVQSYQRGEAVVGTVWETGETLLVDDYRVWDKHDPDCVFSRFTSILAVPIRHSHDEIIGVMGLTYLDEVGVFKPEVIEFLERTAQLVAVALDNLNLFEDLQRSEARARAIFEQSSDALALFDIETKRIKMANHRCAQILGYDNQDDLIGLTAYDITSESSESVDQRFSKDFSSGELRFIPEIRQLKRKDGTSIVVERTLAQIETTDRAMLMASFRDVTETWKLQKELESELRKAAAVQRSLLATDFCDDRLEIRTFYQPYHEVSGDFFGYGWDRSGNVLQGYLIDVMGHGVGTALQTAALNVLFHQAMDEQLSLKQTLMLVNRQVQAYFSEGMFAAAICFELDLPQMTLRYISAGINYFFASAYNLHGLVRVYGSLVGVDDDPDFVEQTVAVQAGDVFYFLTDGLMDKMMRDIPPYLHDIDRVIGAMKLAVPPGGGHDDASALCLRIGDLFRWPIIFELSQPEDAKRLRGRLRDLLGRMVGGKAIFIEVVLNEAINNALRSADRQKTPLIRVKVNKMGARLIFRIRDSGDGFDASGALLSLKRCCPDVRAASDFTEGGRGLPIMWSLSDRLVFNSRGNEVLIMKRI